MLKKLTIFFMLLSFLAGGLLAQEEKEKKKVKDITEVSMDDLLNLEVVTASKKSEKMVEAPAIIDVITSERISNLGVNSLYELLDYLPGIEVMETFFGYTTVNFRGITQTHYNNKVLMLVNGHPMFEAVCGSFFLEIIPIESVKRLEIIRGPGSSLYGTNAFAGVINIITKDPEETNKFLVNSKVGSFSTKYAGVTGAFNNVLSEDGSLLISGSFRDDKGYNFNVVEDEKGNSADIDYENDIKNLFLNYKIKGLNITTALFDQDKAKFGITPVVNYTGISNYKAYLVDVNYKKQASENVDVLFRLRYDKFEGNFDIGQFPFPGFADHEDASTRLELSGNILGFEFQTDYSLGENFTGVSGIVLEKVKSDPYWFRFIADGSVHPFSAFQESYSANDISFFTQLKYRAASNLNGTAGFRVNKNSDYGEMVFAPRLGLVYNPSKTVYFKLLYGEAFRTANHFEKHVGTQGVLFGYEKLKPERIKTLDLGANFLLSENYNLRVNYFNENTSDLITRVPTSKPEEHGEKAAEYDNSTGQKINGIEFQFDGNIQNLGVFGINMSLNSAKNKANDEKYDYIAGTSIKGWVIMNLTDNFRFTPSFIHYGKRHESEAYTLLNCKVSYNINNMSFYIIGKNLLDKDYTYPEYVRKNIATIPGGDRRAFYLGFSYNK